MKITAENRARPATKAPSTRRRRAVRALMAFMMLAETGDEARPDGLEEHGGPVMQPERGGAGEDHANRARSQQDRKGTARRDRFGHRRFLASPDRSSPLRIAPHIVPIR